MESKETCTAAIADYFESDAFKDMVSLKFMFYLLVSVIFIKVSHNSNLMDLLGRSRGQK